MITSIRCRCGSTSCGSAELESEALNQVRCLLSWVVVDLRVSAGPPGTAAGLVAGLLLEDAAVDGARYIASSDGIGNAVLLVHKFDCDPQWSAIVLATSASRPLWFEPALLRISSGENVDSSQAVGMITRKARINSAFARTWGALTVIRVHAETVVWHCGLVPEVHDNSVVLGICSSSNNIEELEVMVVTLFRVFWVAIASPENISAVLRVNVVAAFATEDGIPT